MLSPECCGCFFNISLLKKAMARCNTSKMQRLSSLHTKIIQNLSKLTESEWVIIRYYKAAREIRWFGDVKLVNFFSSPLMFFTWSLRFKDGMLEADRFQQICRETSRPGHHRCIAGSRCSTGICFRLSWLDPAVRWEHRCLNAGDQFGFLERTN